MGGTSNRALISLDAINMRDQATDTSSATSARLVVDGESLQLTVRDVVDGVLLSSGLADIAGPCASCTSSHTPLAPLLVGTCIEDGDVC